YIVASSEDDGLLGLRPESGAIAWQRGDLSGPWLAFAGDKVLSDLHALDPRTGHTLWSGNALYEYETLEGEPLLYGSVMYAGGQDWGGVIIDIVVAVGRADGKTLWRADRATLAGIADGQVYMRDTFMRDDPGTVLRIVDARGNQTNDAIILNPDPAQNADVNTWRSNIPIRITRDHLFIVLNGSMYRYPRKQPMVAKPKRLPVNGDFLGGPIEGWFYFGDKRGLTLVNFNDETVREERIALEGGQTGPIAAYQGAVYVSGGDSRVYQLDPRARRITMRTEPLCRHLQQSVVSDGVLVAVCEDEKKPPTPAPCVDAGTPATPQKICPPPDLRLKVTAFRLNAQRADSR
ncbi:MAG: PQQ-binding-like beta-propeller repeat protein, partial [Candidatus Eremiobacteraeota bacterium]|nr:PQQ-binding-like beta-propeller repeat protein [Candidatus Eremiobacteraeota bacterium]